VREKQRLDAASLWLPPYKGVERRLVLSMEMGGRMDGWRDGWMENAHSFRPWRPTELFPMWNRVSEVTLLFREVNTAVGLNTGRSNHSMSICS
jgi:hypothetical protein